MNSHALRPEAERPAPPALKPGDECAEPGCADNAVSDAAAAVSRGMMDLADARLTAANGAIASIGSAYDRTLNYLISRVTLGLAPAALVEAYIDWIIHLAAAPGKEAELCQEWYRKHVRLTHHVLGCLCSTETPEPCVEPVANDKRFAAPEWQQWPFNFIHQAFLLQEQWWGEATTGVRGITRQHERAVSFAARQILDMVSPANFVASNPVVLNRTIAEGGANLVRGAMNFLEDWHRVQSGLGPVGAEKFEIGENIAATKGRVVFRNHLIELIQYEPTTARVRPEPLLIVPAWIMKYYILDLSAENSFVRYLVGQGFTVFMISWKNPGPEDRDLGLEDYRVDGVMAALDAVGGLVPNVPVHGVGYCLGGTLLSIAAAAMAREESPGNGRRLATLSLFAAQTDFTEAGELTLFINESQLAFLEDVMREQGYLAAGQMAGAFQMLRSNDLIWSRGVHDYLMGERTSVSDLMAWNADSTRMPARMHAEYLRQLFLDNDLAEGRFKADGRPVAVTDIRVPIFAVGTETDHVAPWRSVFKIRLLADTDVTFLLTTGGHNAGIVAGAQNGRRSYRVASSDAADAYVDPEAWLAKVQQRQGSWWPEWVAWLKARSGDEIAPPRLGGIEPPCNAPGTYVLAR